jgi:ankyrin repeat protein
MSAQELGNLLISACKGGNLASAQSSVIRGARTNFRCGYGATPAIWCCIKGHLEILEYLLERGANAKLALPVNGWTPLHNASLNNKPECVTALLRHGLVVDAITTYGETALYLASRRGYLPVVQLLVKAGADVKRATNYDRTPLSAARQFGHAETPLSAARQFGHAEVVAFLKAEIEWKRRRAPFAMVFCSIKNVNSDAKIFRVLQNRDTAALIASYL